MAPRETAETMAANGQLKMNGTKNGVNGYGTLPTHDPSSALELTVDDEDGEQKTTTTFRCLSGGNVLLAAALALTAVAIVFAHMGPSRSGGGGGAGGRGGGDGEHKVVAVTAALSTATPEDLGMRSVERNQWNVPGKVWGRKLLGMESSDGEEKKKPLPTNSWYLNFLTQNAGEGSNEANQVYTVPYILDTVGSITGLRVHWPIMKATSINMQMVYDARHGLTLGTDDKDVGRGYVVDDEVEDPSPLGLSLKWGDDEGSMTTHIVRGMPYATVKYSGVNPSIASGNVAGIPPLLDGETELSCGEILTGGGYSSDAKSVKVEREIRLHFRGSDFTWIAFLSRPMKVKCANAGPAAPGVVADVMFQMKFEEVGNKKGGGKDEAEPLFVRVAMLDQCTTGHSDIKAHCEPEAKWSDQDGYSELLRESAGLFPGGSATLDIDYSPSEKSDEAHVMFDWDVRSIDEADASASEEKGRRLSGAADDDEPELIMFALPHHQTILEPIEGLSTNAVTHHCIPTFHGSTCLVRGSKWSLTENLGPPQSFFADRAPEPWAVPDLAAAAVKDIALRPSDNMYRGAADTYFSGKILAKLGRVVLIASELRELAAGGDDEVVDAAAAATPVRADKEDERRTAAAKVARDVDLPTDDDITDAVHALKRAVQVWIDGTAEAEYVYDSSWGGLVNCGCNYEGEGDRGTCVNEYPDCPALADVNVDFGNGYYMDHHFHYGYHIYAAAVVAKYDPEWGREFFDRVLLYIRDIANPSPADSSFPLFRHKDWYLGSSWASGLISAGIPTPPHGRNQESSSEAIAAYEAIALFGKVMVDAYSETDGPDSSRKEDAELVRDVGRLLTSMEVHAANRYWHVWNSTSHTNTYPAAYTKPVVGMLYETMASFQTWFAPEDFVSYGIQLLPFTPVSERRDDPEWVAKVYPAYKESCDNTKDFCVDNGWTIVLSGIRAAIGEREEAIEDALSIPDGVFLTDGGCGHSLSNTLWYIATRPDYNGVDDQSTVADQDSTVAKSISAP